MFVKILVITSTKVVLKKASKYFVFPIFGACRYSSIPKTIARSNIP